jgi:hypothetical protein
MRRAARSYIRNEIEVKQRRDFRTAQERCQNAVMAVKNNFCFFSGNGEDEKEGEGIEESLGLF